jgi:hypothetical protein
LLFAARVRLSHDRLTEAEARQQLLAEATASQHQEDWTPTAEWSSSDPKIATVDEHGMVRPAGDGEARITARAKGIIGHRDRSRAEFARAVQWSFRNHVIPVMTKMGCNQGACHGALAGKNGFKLSPARLRSGSRLRHPDPAIGGTARIPGRSRREPDVC